MEKLPVCRICLVENVRMYIVGNRNLHELYEKLTDIPFMTEDSRPILACFFCCAKLKQCYRLLQQCLAAEELFAQRMNEDYEPNPLSNQDRLQLFSGFIKTPIENINIVDECQTESIAVKEEIPAVCEALDDVIEPKEEYQSDELELENLDNSCLDVADIPPHHSESDSEDDEPLMQLKIEVEDEEVSTKKRRVRDSRKLELENLDNSCLDVADIPPHHSESDSEDDEPLMQLKIVVEDEEVSKKKRRVRDTRKATVARKPKLDTRRTKEKDAIPAEQTTKDKSDSKVIRTTQKRTAKRGTYFKEPYKCNQRNSNQVKKEYKCEVCQRSFSQKWNLSTHIRTHTGEKPYKCNLCRRSFSQKNQLSVHIFTHADEKPYKCDVCQRGYYSVFGLTKHIRIHTGEKPYKCDVCQRSFTLNSTLSRHIRTHTGEKPFKCDVCQRCFSEKGTLKKHIRIHTGEKPYKCNVCQRSFSQNSTFSMHMRTHTGEKSYNCDVCQRSFNSKNNLAVHVRTHTGEKPYKCDLCRRSFSQKCNLLMHIRTHTGEKPYKCDLCRRFLSTKTTLANHMHTHTD